MSADTGGAAEQKPGTFVEEIEALRERTLLDHFAGQALTGMLAYSHVNPMIGNYHENCTIEAVAHHAYDIAAAMLTERARRTEGK